MFPIKRNRRLRKNNTIRKLVQENNLSPNDFIVPLFIIEGKNKKEKIESMPDYYRYSIDLIKNEVKKLWEIGLKSVLLFVKVVHHHTTRNTNMQHATHHVVHQFFYSIYIYICIKDKPHLLTKSIKHYHLLSKLI